MRKPLAKHQLTLTLQHSKNRCFIALTRHDKKPVTNYFHRVGKMGSVTKFCNCYVLRDHNIIKEDILVRDGKFLNPEPLFFDEKREADHVVDCNGLLISPGLIDLQINGGFGVDFSHDIRSAEEAKICLGKVAKGLLKYGKNRND